MTPSPTAKSPADAASIFHRPARTRRVDPSLSLERITASTVALLDREGAAALTMRALANELGAHASSIYWYVDRREDLVDLATDFVFGPAAGRTPKGDWEHIIRTTATEMYTALTDHAWAAEFAGQRPLLGPNALTLVSRIIRALDSTGATGKDQAIAGTSISNLVLGAATASAAARHLRLDDGESALTQHVIAAVQQVTEPANPVAAWTAYFDEGLDMLIHGWRTRTGIFT
ncbi:TetR/AcrR family transcriptional regulator C-terminal domain-containing protein [Paenarthrobacter aurescens]|uniref:TetR/AcrR family transcriptional regulator C-terminal domain-containing protein n=1 Tax=Paenarthrobacter aurescens TaxID=43663 RepID=UPI0035EC7F66